jgi:ketosteroid isomerase-like protein
MSSSIILVVAWLATGCAGRACPGAESPQPSSPLPARGEHADDDRSADRRAIDRLIDGWHAAAARADERAYFEAMTEGAIFLGTDAEERWDKAAFQRYAHPHFAKGKAWSFDSIRRDVIFGPGGRIAWFDEDLATPNLGPARGSGVVVEESGRWRIAHYNLAITVPNERFDDVRDLLDRDPTSTEPDEDAADEPSPTPATDR